MHSLHNFRALVCHILQELLQDKQITGGNEFVAIRENETSDKLRNKLASAVFMQGILRYLLHAKHQGPVFAPMFIEEFRLPDTFHHETKVGIREIFPVVVKHDLFLCKCTHHEHTWLGTLAHA